MTALNHKKTGRDSSPITCQILTSLSEIESIASEWDALLDQSPCNRAFSCSKWYLAAARTEDSFSPYVIIALRGSQIAGILPTAITNDGEMLTFAGELSDYNDVIARETDHQVLEALMSRVLHFGSYKRVVLNRVRCDSNCARAVRFLSPSVDLAKSFSIKTNSRYIRLPSSYGDYLSTRSRNFRKNLKRARRDAENHNVSVCELDVDTFSPARIAEVFLSLNLERWGPECYYNLDRPRMFVSKILPDLFAERRLRAFALMSDQNPIALDLCMVGANSLCSWNGGFLSKASRWSPGTLLIDAGIKHSYSAKFEEYDLLRGEEPYKQRWVNSTREIGSFEFNANCS